MEFRGIMGGLYKFSEWIMRLAVINVLWVVCSIPFFFLMLTIFVTPDIQTNPSFLRQWLVLLGLVAPFTLMPASGAMFTVVRKWVTGDVDVPLVKTFFRGYKENYRQSMFGGLVLEVIGVILYVNYIFYNGQSGSTKMLSFVFLIFLIMLFATFMNYLSIMVHFHMKFWQVVKNSLLLTIGHPLVSVSIVILNGVILYFSSKYTFLIPFFMGSMMASASFFLFYRSFERMKEKMQRKEDADAERNEAKAAAESHANSTENDSNNDTDADVHQVHNTDKSGDHTP